LPASISPEETFFSRARLGERLALSRASDANEFEQAKLRAILHSLITAYFLAAFLWDRTLDDGELRMLALLGCFLLMPFLYFGWIALRPGVNHWRRCAGVLTDVTSVTLLMLLGGEPGMLLYPLYLWIVIGNGFRFGRPYLHYAQVLAIAGFLTVLLFNPLWSAHATLGAALALVLIVIPAYVSALLGRLNAASRRLEAARGEAEAANVAKTRFLAAASHDLRQPMQALSMYASVLADRVTGHDAARVVRGVQLSVRTLEQLFDSLLDIARIESGVIRPNVVTFPLAPLIDNVVEAERPAAAHKGLAIRVVATSASVRSDPVLLERILKNLVTNAVRYTERGRIVVGCRRAGRRLRLQVADSGVGIPAQEQERIFEEYYQLEGASAEGLGLGLSIVKSLAALLGHPVSLRSTLGRGSIFSLGLEAAREFAAPVSAAGAGVPSLAGAIVALVDDDAEIRESMRLLLESWGARCITGASAAEVETRLRSSARAPDALIADYRLGGADTGLQAIARLRGTYGQALPALIITGTANLAALEQDAPGIPVAAKPVPPGKLRAFLAQVAREG
jgi:signal transduction histidine kinase/CheY-like chemotaxis protein